MPGAWVDSTKTKRPRDDADDGKPERPARKVKVAVDPTTPTSPTTSKKNASTKAEAKTKEFPEGTVAMSLKESVVLVTRAMGTTRVQPMRNVKEPKARIMESVPGEKPKKTTGKKTTVKKTATKAKAKVDKVGDAREKKTKAKAPAANNSLAEKEKTGPAKKVSKKAPATKPAGKKLEDCLLTEF